MNSPGLQSQENHELTFILVVRSDGKNSVLNVLVLVHLGFVQLFVEVRRVIVLVGDGDSDELGHGVRLSTGVGSRRGGSVTGLNLQGVGALGLTIEDGFGADLARLRVDLEVPLAFRVRDDVVVDLIKEENR